MFKKGTAFWIMIRFPRAFKELHFFFELNVVYYQFLNVTLIKLSQNEKSLLDKLKMHSYLSNLLPKFFASFSDFRNRIL